MSTNFTTSADHQTSGYRSGMSESTAFRLGTCQLVLVQWQVLGNAHPAGTARPLTGQPPRLPDQRLRLVDGWHPRIGIAQPEPAARSLAVYARPKEITKKPRASHTVALVRKEVEPALPNIVLDPNRCQTQRPRRRPCPAATAQAPAIASASTTRKQSSTGPFQSVVMSFATVSFSTSRLCTCGRALLYALKNCSASNDAPPTSPPSTSDLREQYPAALSAIDAATVEDSRKPARQSAVVRPPQSCSAYDGVHRLRI